MSENSLSARSVAFAIITSYPKWYRGKVRSTKHTDKIRGDLALGLFNRITKKGYRLVVGDSKSPHTFLQDLAAIPGLILFRRRSVKRSSAKKQAVKKASELPGVIAIVMTEPEKASLFYSVSACIGPVLKGKASVVIPKRNERLFRETYPSYMYHSEKEGNRLYNEILKTSGLMRNGEDFDWFFGPRIFANKKEVVSLFTRRYRFTIAHTEKLHDYFDFDSFSTSLYFPVVLAMKKRMKVESVEVPFRYPILQRKNEEGSLKELFFEKRKNQRMSLLIGLLYYVSRLKGRS